MTTVADLKSADRSGVFFFPDSQVNAFGVFSLPLWPAADSLPKAVAG